VELLSPWSESVENERYDRRRCKSTEEFSRRDFKKVSIEDVWKRFRKRPWLW